MALQIIKVPYPLPSGLFSGRAAGDITDLIIHHTAGPENQTPLEIDDYARREHGDIFIPYGYLIDNQGVVYDGRPDLCKSAASYGRNLQSIAVCVIGNFVSKAPTPRALDSLRKLSLQLHQTYPSIVRTIGHRDIATMFYPMNTGDYATQCPGDALYKLIPTVRAYCAKYAQTEQDSTPVPETTKK